MNGITKMIFRNFENTIDMINNLLTGIFSKNSIRDQYFQNIFYNELDIGYDPEVSE